MSIRVYENCKKRTFGDSQIPFNIVLLAFYFLTFSPSNFQEGSFHGLKGFLSSLKRVPFAVQKGSFCNLKGLLLRRCFAIIALLLLFSHLQATPFSPTWISCPRYEKGAEVWFRHTYSFAQRPLSAYISLATTGRAELFINGRNVSTDVLSPTRDDAETVAATTVYDVTRFLHGRNNVVAVWFSPLTHDADARQVALSLYGTDASGQSFCYEADGDWLCRQAPIWLGEEDREYIDGREQTHLWLDDEIEVAQWQNVDEMGENCSESQSNSFCMAKEMKVDYTATKVSRIENPGYFDIVGDSLVYDFGYGIEGLLRVTLREAKRGEQIVFGNIVYTCSGQIDEQIIQRFHTTNARRILVYGDEKFKREQIVSVEMLTLVPYRHFSYK